MNIKAITVFAGIVSLLWLCACGSSDKPAARMPETPAVEAPAPEVVQPQPVETPKTPEESAAENAAVRKAADEREKLPGPVGVIKRKDVNLLTSPKLGSSVRAALDQFENVYILQFIMTDAQGKETPYPTWYQVERKDKKRGWVEAKVIDAGGGG